MAVSPELLARSPYFAGLSTTQAQAVSQLVFEKSFTRDEIIILEGEKADALYFVASGAVKIFKTSAEGKEQILEIILPGNSFNDAAALSGGTNRYTAQAMGAVVLYGLPRDKLEILLKDYHRVARNVIGVLADQILRLTALVADLSFRTVTGRLARILLDYAADGSRDVRPLSQREMAAMAGTVREVVGRSLKELADRGAINLDRHRIVIKDRKALDNIAGAADET